ncbi:hypothetical protein [Xenorhabdus siamensis]|uniref:hypothetical protein n=1 Tax=Xenorhabdus siamensis TaxID=3136254 RepID=UPI0030F43528
MLSHITAELDNGILNTTSIITLFRQIITHNIPLNSWLKQIWQTIVVANPEKIPIRRRVSIFIRLLLQTR